MSGFPVFGDRQPPHDPARLARTILAQPRFRIQAQAAQTHTWWDELRKWIGDRWNALMNALAHHVKIGPGASAALGDLLIAALVLLVVIVGVRLLVGAARERVQLAGIDARPLPVHAGAEDLFEAARHAADAGAYATAVALAFRAALAALDARGALRDDPARTVNECRRDVRARAPRFSGAFDTIARAFTAAVYAEDRAGAEQWSEVARAYGAFSAAPRDAA